MKIDIRDTPLNPWQELAAHEQAQGSLRTQIGAAAVFVGSMRDFNEDAAVSSLWLEHYPGMSERELEKIARQAVARWALDDLLIIHRTGQLQPADPIVLVAAWSAHRKEAFESCRHIMETLKSSVPFWKKEQRPDGSQRWVEKNTAGF